VKKLETQVFVGNTATNTAKTELVTVSIVNLYCFTNAIDSKHEPFCLILITLIQLVLTKKK